jgi:cell division septum initiation protein DivIVA
LGLLVVGIVLLVRKIKSKKTGKKAMNKPICILLCVFGCMFLLPAFFGESDPGSDAVARSTYDSLNEKYDTLEDEYDLLESENKTLLESNKSLEQQIEKLQNNNDSNDNDSNELSEIAKENDKLKSENKNLKDENKKLQKEIDKLKSSDSKDTKQESANSKENESTVSMPEIDVSTYKAQCKVIGTDVEYKDLLRHPEKYIGSYVTMTVQVKQSTETSFWSDEVAYRCNSDESGYDFYMDDEYYVADNRAENSEKILKDDIIKVYGEFTGVETVTRALTGTKEDIPQISMKFSELIEE